MAYTKEHEWVRLSNDESTGTVLATIGITDYAQKSLGDLVYVELPKVGKYYEKAGNGGKSVIVNPKNCLGLSRV